MIVMDRSVHRPSSTGDQLTVTGWQFAHRRGQWTVWIGRLAFQVHNITVNQDGVVPANSLTTHGARTASQHTAVMIRKLRKGPKYKLKMCHELNNSS